MSLYDFSDEMDFVVVQCGDTFSKIVSENYHLFSSIEINQKIESLLQYNPHISDRDKIYPGQVIALGPIDSANDSCLKPLANDLREIESQIKPLLFSDFQSFCLRSESLAILDKGFGSSEFLGPGFSVASSSSELANLIEEGLRGISKARIKQHALKIARKEHETAQTINSLLDIARQSRDSRRRVSGRARGRNYRFILRGSNQRQGMRNYAHSLQRVIQWNERLKSAGRVSFGFDILNRTWMVTESWGSPRQYQVLAKETLGGVGSYSIAEAAKLLFTPCVSFLGATGPLGVTACAVGTLTLGGITAYLYEEYALEALLNRLH